MKSVKRILSVTVAVLLIAMMMIPAVSAADYSFTLKTEKPGYEFTVYPLATLKTTTGKYEATDNVTDSTVKSAILTSTYETADLLEACKKSTGLGDGLADKFVSSTSTEKTYNVGAGIYYVKCTDVPVNNKEILQESIVVLPYKDGTQTINSLTIDYDQNGKIKELGEPGVKKHFKLGDETLTKEDQTFGSNDEITYVLTADVTGSTANKLTSYIITDTMGKGLDKREESINIKSVVLKNGTTETPLTAGTNYTVITEPADIGGATFGVSIDATTVLDKNDFYATGNQVVVTYTTKLASDAPVNTNIPNTDALIYSNGSDTKTIPGDTVNAKTYKVVAKKVDATTKAPLARAKFGLYQDAACTKQIAESPKTGNDGIADFGVKLPAGTYYVKEIEAPEGYNLNSAPQKVDLPDDVDNATKIATVVIEDTHAKLPNTGGNGTLMFTIIGGSLVLLAAALFVVVMKKKSSAK